MVNFYFSTTNNVSNILYLVAEEGTFVHLDSYFCFGEVNEYFVYVPDVFLTDVLVYANVIDDTR